MTSDALPPGGRRGLPRIPFGALVEQGLLRAGQELYLGARGEATAVVLPDGHIRCGERTGSIHRVASDLRGAPCNGWEHWYYLDPVRGERVPIDRLRQELRERSARLAAGPQQEE